MDKGFFSKWEFNGGKFRLEREDLELSASSIQPLDLDGGSGVNFLFVTGF